jgi:hypothetical protein
MTDRVDLEVRFATTLAPVLLALAVFSLSTMTLVKAPGCTFTDEFLAILAGVCIFASAVIIDSALDSAQIDGLERLSFLQFGYLLFCIVVGSLTTAVFVLYAAKQADAAGQPYRWEASTILFAFAGISVVGKMMWFRDRNAFVISMFLFYALSVYVSPSGAACTV